MSRNTELRADLNRVGYQLGGAHLTQDARRATFSTFAHAMREKGYGIQSAEQIGANTCKRLSNTDSLKASAVG